MTRLLVSVRSAAEAEAALAGGAAVIDVKEPTHGRSAGPTTRSSPTWSRTVAGRAPVSAALGELRDRPERELAVVPAVAGLREMRPGWVRGEQGDWWRSAIDALAGAVQETAPSCRMVVVAYADWRRAQAPPPDEVCTFVCRRPGWGLLLDTWGKDGLTLLDWMSRVEMDRICRVCRDAGVTIALAGSLGRSLIRTLKPTAPDWFAVRGAACEGLQPNRRRRCRQGARIGRSPSGPSGRQSRKLTARTCKDGAGRPQRPREPFIDEAAFRRFFPVHALRESSRI